MKTVSMTMLNEHPREVVKLVEAGEAIQVLRHGQPVLRMVPEPTLKDPLGSLIAAGLIAEPVRPRRAPRRDRPLMSEHDADRAIAWLTWDGRA
jgi:antitoxin (DNA-binding transcriptional repressor) of toxin-antitoxin stability system